jgi:hypothetical protein
LPARKQNAANQNATDDVVTDIVKTKQKRNRPDLAKFGEENTEPGDNSRYLRMARVSLSLPPIDISDASQVENRINQYFDFCEQNDRKPNMIGMANWLGVDRATVNSWKTGEYRSESHLPVIKKAVDILEELWVDYMMNGKVNPGSGIFIGKNLFQYKDVQDVVVTPNNPLEQMDSNTARKRLIDAIPAEQDE